MTTKPNWHDGVLRVTGELTMLEASIQQSDNIITPRILAVDAAGVQWLLTHSSFPFDMHPHKLPVPFHARYKLEIQISEFSRYTYYADAASVDEAIAKIKACDDFYVPREGTWSMDLNDRLCVQPATGEKPKGR